jgi:uncharacterized membrane protein
MSEQPSKEFLVFFVVGLAMVLSFLALVLGKIDGNQFQTIAAAVISGAFAYLAGFKSGLEAAKKRYPSLFKVP